MVFGMLPRFPLRHPFSENDPTMTDDDLRNDEINEQHLEEEAVEEMISSEEMTPDEEAVMEEAFQEELAEDETSEEDEFSEAEHLDEEFSEEEFDEDEFSEEELEEVLAELDDEFEGEVNEEAESEATAEDAGDTMRLQKFLASAGLGSRRKCEAIILEGRISVDGVQITDVGVKVNSRLQTIEYDGEPLKFQRRTYYLLNKPKGVLCTNYDPDHRPRVIDLFENEDKRLFTVGRLDEDSEGLLLVTNDGELANKLAHPRYRVRRVYEVQVAGLPTLETLEELKKGFYFTEGRFAVEDVRKKGRKGMSTILEVTLRQGQNREIRRLFARVNHKVMSLKRTEFGTLRLGNLKAGQYRPLTSQELRNVREMSENPESNSSRGPRQRPTQGKFSNNKFSDKKPFKPQSSGGFRRQDDDGGQRRPGGYKPGGYKPGGFGSGGRRPDYKPAANKFSRRPEHDDDDEGSSSGAPHPAMGGPAGNRSGYQRDNGDRARRGGGYRSGGQRSEYRPAGGKFSRRPEGNDESGGEGQRSSYERRPSFQRDGDRGPRRPGGFNGGGQRSGYRPSGGKFSRRPEGNDESGGEGQRSSYERRPSFQRQDGDRGPRRPGGFRPGGQRSDYKPAGRNFSRRPEGDGGSAGEGQQGGERRSFGSRPGGRPAGRPGGKPFGNRPGGRPGGRPFGRRPEGESGEQGGERRSYGPKRGGSRPQRPGQKPDVFKGIHQKRKRRPE